MYSNLQVVKYQLNCDLAIVGDVGVVSVGSAVAFEIIDQVFLRSINQNYLQLKF